MLRNNPEGRIRPDGPKHYRVLDKLFNPLRKFQYRTVKKLRNHGLLEIVNDEFTVEPKPTRIKRKP